MRRFCSWAACGNPAGGVEDGYLMCAPHLREHREMVEEDQRRVDAERRGKRMTKPLTPCPSHAAYERHRRASETPCEGCVSAEREYQRIRQQRRRAS